MSQLSFEWQSHTSYALEDFIISASNEEAVRFLEFFPNPHAKVALLSGPAACGKTHLARLWAEKTGGMIIDKSFLGLLPSDQLWQGFGHAILEDIEAIKDEASLFHLLREAEVQGKCLLMTASMSAKQLPFTLPDLCSRLLALSAVSIAQPDEELLHIYAAKCLSDRQLRVSDAVVQYLLIHAERSFAAVYDIIGKLEKISMKKKRDITIPLLKKLFKNIY